MVMTKESREKFTFESVRGDQAILSMHVSDGVSSDFLMSLHEVDSNAQQFGDLPAFVQAREALTRAETIDSSR